MNIALWVMQALLALAFLAAGFPKLTQPIPQVAKRLAWAAEMPAPLVRFIGLAEVLGAVGLLLPGITHIAPNVLTVAAAIGLAVVMVAAMIFRLSRKENARIAPNLVLFILAALIVVGRLTGSALS